jgi:hypothetical protein
MKMDTEITVDEMRSILTGELRQTKAMIYDRSVMIEARRMAGYDEKSEAITSLVADCEKLIKVRDTLQKKLDELATK